MKRRNGSLLTVAAIISALCLNASAQTPKAASEGASPNGDDAVMITIFFKHDQSRPLDEINAQLKKQGYYEAFPPPGMEVASWYVIMGIGQVITLRLPASRLRELNRIVEDKAWGAYRTEFYPTYDYKTAGMKLHDDAPRDQ